MFIKGERIISYLEGLVTIFKVPLLKSDLFFSVLQRHSYGSVCFAIVLICPFFTSRLSHLKANSLDPLITW